MRDNWLTWNQWNRIYELLHDGFIHSNSGYKNFIRKSFDMAIDIRCWLFRNYIKLRSLKQEIFNFMPFPITRESLSSAAGEMSIRKVQVDSSESVTCAINETAQHSDNILAWSYWKILQRTRLSTHIAIFLLLRELLQNLHETSPLFHADTEKLKEENVGCLKNHLKHKYLALSEQQREKANICVGTENKQRVWDVQKVEKEFC